NGVTIAGGNGSGNATNQLYHPHGLFVDEDQTVVVADYLNHRIIQWKNGDTTNGQVVAGGKGQGNGLHSLFRPTDVLIDKETDSLIICDDGNRRVVRWSRRSGTAQGEILIDNIYCNGLAMDEQRYLYVSDWIKHEVRRYQLGENIGTLVAGGKEQGAGLNQLNWPTYLFVGRDHSAYVSYKDNHRVMKWKKGAKEGIVLAGGQGRESALTQLNSPLGLFVDTLGAVYVADYGNHRILLFLDNAPVHPPDVQLENIKLKFFPPNTTAKIQPMDQGIIRAFKVYYRRHLVKFCLLDQGVCEAVSETTIRNTFKSAGFEKLSVIDGIDAVQQISITNEIISAEDKSIEELDRVLRHLTIESIDDNAPSFNEWNDSNDKLLVINRIINDDGDSNEDQLNDDVPSEDPPSLSECLDLVRRLCFFSTMQQPELHSFIIEL
ncbi:unnamed protein product, partial [Rotaria magnacalcarata]